MELRDKSDSFMNWDRVEQADPEVTFNLSKSQRNRESSSSEEQIDTSNETLDVDNFIADCESNARRRQSMSEGNERRSRKSQFECDQMIRESENAKVAMYATPGNAKSPGLCEPVINNMLTNVNPHHYQLVDQQYQVISGGVDEVMRNRIINHEYIDFVKLLPRDRVSRQEDNRMELINKGGSTYFIPVVDRENGSGGINNFSRWEQAFRVYSNVFSKAYPDRASELIEYNHLIFTASLSFSWDNVYRYDKEFRIHMSNFPLRNWGVILQQAWSVYLKDRVSSHKYDDINRSQGSPTPGKKKDICKRFNKGKCNRGFRCQFEHRCLGCGKFGHGIHICRDRKPTTSEQTPQTSGGKT